MSNRKGYIKKPLNFVEYPWSTDDEDGAGQAVVQDTNRQRSGVAHPSEEELPGTSGLQSQPPVQTLSQQKEKQYKISKNMLWSLVNNVKETAARLENITKTIASRPSASSNDRNSQMSNQQPTLEGISNTNEMNRFHQTHSLSDPLSDDELPTPARINDTPPFDSFMPFHPRPSYREERVGRHLRVQPDRMRSFWKETESQDMCHVTYVHPTHHHSYPRSEPTAAEETESPDMCHLAYVHPTYHSYPRSEPTAAEETESQDMCHVTYVHPTHHHSYPRSEPTAAEGLTRAPASGTEEESVANYTSNVNLQEEIDTLSTNEDDVTVITAIVNEPTTSEAHGVKRKREEKDDEKKNITIQEFNHSLLKLVECPVCMEYMKSPMIQCRRGHIVCSKCRARLEICPVCRSDFTVVRNRAMEAVSELLHYPCRHGCGRGLLLKRRAKHENSCAERRYKCPASDCGVRKLAKDLLSDHFLLEHRPLVLKGVQHRLKVDVALRERQNWLLLAEGENFHLQVIVEERIGAISAQLMYLGPKKHCKRYTYTITIEGNRNAKKLTYSRTAQSDLDIFNTSLTNFTTQDCLVLNMDQAMNFIQTVDRQHGSNKYLNLVIEITKTETEECDS